MIRAEALTSVNDRTQQIREARGAAVRSAAIREKLMRRDDAEAGRRPMSASSSALLAQPLELMGHDPRQQPRAGHDDQTQLLKKREGVQLEPVLRNPSVDEAVEL
jgi:hypothetical protein